MPILHYQGDVKTDESRPAAIWTGTSAPRNRGKKPSPSRPSTRSATAPITTPWASPMGCPEPVDLLMACTPKTREAEERSSHNVKRSTADCDPSAHVATEPCWTDPKQESDCASDGSINDSLGGSQGISAQPFQLPTSPQAWTRSERLIKPAIVLAVSVLFLAIVAQGRLWTLDSLIPHTLRGSAFWGIAFAYGFLMYAVLIWRVNLWRRYKPMEGIQDEDLPSVSVIIPAYNEGALVEKAILSVAASRYPLDRLEIIAIDDGSEDDTWPRILSAARRLRGRMKITTLRHRANRGKREALYLGFAKAHGDVFVTIDSDSVLEPDSLRNAVTPLVREPEIGCVAGCVQVLNPRQSLITRFLKCTFSLSFKFVRAYQSEFRGVFCTPGALSVYRADVVRKVAGEWLDQRFLGRRCVTGEDRAMTNLFLREGWLTAYQGNAVVWSNMPHTYVGLTRMFLRWARSNIRETVVLFRFLFKPFRESHLKAFRLNMLLVAMSLVLPVVLIANSVALLATSDGYLLHHLGVVLIYALTVSAIYYKNERDSDWIWLLVYEFFWVACISWIIPYAALTLRNTGWLTRQSSKDDQSRAREEAVSAQTCKKQQVGHPYRLQWADAKTGIPQSEPRP